jgi:hypothetical protein
MGKINANFFYNKMGLNCYSVGCLQYVLLFYKGLFTTDCDWVSNLLLLKILQRFFRASRNR